MSQTLSSIYYAGFEVSSSTSRLTICPPDGHPLAQDEAILPSLIADGDLATLFQGGDQETKLADVLQQDDYVFTWHNRTYFLGNLVAHGIPLVNAFHDEHRYWSEHTYILLLCLACTLIPEHSFELRLVTALPVSLYDRERRQRVKHALSQHAHFIFNGAEREVSVKCGYVAMEGQGTLIHCGYESGKQAVIDIGEDSTNLIVADGHRLIYRLCKGEPFGVRQLVENLQLFAYYHRSTLSVRKAHALLEAYMYRDPYPTITTATGNLSHREITTAIEQSIRRVFGPLYSFFVDTWMVECAPAGSPFNIIYLSGAGADYFEDMAFLALGHCQMEIVPNQLNANIYGYADLAIELDTDCWQVNALPSPVDGESAKETHGERNS